MSATDAPPTPPPPVRVKREKVTTPPPPPPPAPPRPSPQRPEVQRRSSGQQSITSYFGGGAAAPSLPSEPPVDAASARGAFGWTTLGGVHVPYLLRGRGQDPFASVRVIERVLLRRFLRELPPEVYSCTHVKSYYVTEHEARLLAEINERHCERQFGAEPFTSRDLVVPLDDVIQLHRFLAACHRMLTGAAPTTKRRADEHPCGLLRIGGVIAPFVRRFAAAAADGIRLVPLAFVSGVIGATEPARSWELAYLKFCSKVALMDASYLDATGVVPLVVAPPNAEEFWPTPPTPPPLTQPAYGFTGAGYAPTRNNYQLTEAILAATRRVARKPIDAPWSANGAWRADSASSHHRHVVAPGNQAQTSKMASPKPAYAAPKLHELLSGSAAAVAGGVVEPPPYVVQPVSVAGLRLHAVNSIPHRAGVALMVAVAEVERCVEPLSCAAAATPQLCEHVLAKLLRVNLYESSRAQDELLRRNIGVLPPRGTSSARLKLVAADDLARLLPQLLYALSRLRAHFDEAAPPPPPPTKRTRYQAGVNA